LTDPNTDSDMKSAWENSNSDTLTDKRRARWLPYFVFLSEILAFTK
jgi:hypothetical protein